jgi:hypothetical protein
MLVSGNDENWEKSPSYTSNEEQIACFQAGSALNLMALKGRREVASSVYSM